MPVILHHGFLSGHGATLASLPGVRTFSGGIERAITDRGHPLLVTRVHATQSIAHRAAQLKSQVMTYLLSRKNSSLSSSRCIIVAHSMGGLDTRHMISHLGMADHVAAVITLCTPHRGTPFADWLLHHTNRIPLASRLLNVLGLNWPSLRDLTCASMKQFNLDTPDAPGVEYFSVAGVTNRISVPKFMFHTHEMIRASEGENDGIVSVKSAKWGKYLDTWPVDHLYAINRRITLASIVGGDIAHRYSALLDQVGMTLNGTNLHGASAKTA